MNRRMRRNLLFAGAVIAIALAAAILTGIVHVAIVTVQTIHAE